MRRLLRKTVHIFGCGPAGLLCAHAADQLGMRPKIYSRKQKSVIPGSQYLHGPIREITAVYPEGTVQYVRLGTAEGYAEKVYGDKERYTGWHNYLQIVPSWNVLEMYDVLWDRYGDQVVDADITPDFIYDLDMACYPTFSTIPQQNVCIADHIFEGSPYYIKTLDTPPIDAHHDIVIYNGLPGDLWYRWSILGGRCSIEATRDIWMNDPTVTSGMKATDNNCNCWPWIHRIGRWAEWRHGVLLHSAYENAFQIMKGLR